MSTHAPEVVTVGETMGLFFPSAKMPLASRPPFHLSFGGAETNFAIGLSRLGNTTTWVGRLGSDEVGRFIDHELRAEGVSTLRLFGPEHTGLMVRSPKGFGRTAVQYSRTGSAGSQLTRSDVPAAVIDSARVLHLTGITAALGDGPLDAILHAARTAKASGTTVSLDLNYRASLWSPAAARPVLSELTSLADVVFATTDEAEVLLGEASTAAGSFTNDEHSDAALAAQIRALGPTEVVLKRGSDGALALTPDGTYLQCLTRVVENDPVGAGDAFAAGYVHGLLTRICTAGTARLRGSCRRARSDRGRRLGGSPTSRRPHG